MAAFVLFVLVGCSGDGASDSAKVAGTVDGDLGLELVLSTDTTVAGTALDWSTIVHHGDGSTETVTGAALSSDVEAELRQTASAVTPVVAGVQTLTASWTSPEGVVETGQAWVDVAPGDAASLTVALSTSQTSAGEPVTITTTASDRYGNAVDTSATAYSGDSTDVIVEADSAVSTVPGIYTVTGTLGDATDSQSFRVVAGEAAALDLELSDTNVELYESTVASIRITDVYGNVVATDAELWVEGDGDVEVAAHDITFYSEGSFYVYAQSGDLDDVVGPILVDSTGPTLDVHNPDRGEMTTETTSTVTGTCIEPYSSLDTVTVNGVPVEVGDDGSFSADVDYSFGVNVVETSATDSDGNETVDTRAVMSGDYLGYGEECPDGLVARLNQEAFDELEALGETLINGTDLTTLVPNPAYSNYSESCVDVIFDEICIEWYSIDLSITNPSIGGTDLEIDPNAAGYLDTSFTVYTPSIDWSADGAVLGIGYSTGGTIYADWMKLELLVQPYVSGGELGVTLVDTSFTSSGFVFDWDSWIQDVMDFFGVDLSSLVEGYLDGAVEDLLTSEVPTLISDIVGDLELNYPLTIGDHTFQLDAVPSSVSVDDLGLTLGLGSTFTADSWDHAETGPGSLYAHYAVPSYTDGTPGMQVSISWDFVNQVLYALWGSGMLDMQMTADDLGLDLSSVGPYLGFSDLTIATYALMPPVIIPGADGTMGQLQIGDLELVIYDGPADPSNVAYDVYATIFADFSLSAADGLLSPSIGEPEVWFDVVTPANDTQYSEDVETLLSAFIPMFFPQLTDALGTIPLPDISGFPLTIDSIDGEPAGWVTIGGDLSVDSLDGFGF